MKKQLSWICFAAALILTACNKQYFPKLEDGQVAVSIGHCSPAGNEFRICFDSLITDSRCPRDVQCVWAGQAIIRVSFYENDRSHQFNMLLGGRAGAADPGDTTIAGYHIVFEDLKPYPVHDKSQPANQYTALFRIQ